MISKKVKRKLIVDKDYFEHPSNPEGDTSCGKKGIPHLMSTKHNFTNAQVLEIKRLLAQGIKGASIARQFSTSESRISSIKHQKSWRHIYE